MRIRRLAIFGAIVVMLGATAGVASAATSSPPATSTGPTVYATQVVGSPIPLTPASKVVLTSPVLPAGNFLVTFDVTLLLQPETNVQCWLDVNGTRLDQMSGAAGVGASNFGAVYANDSESYVIPISQPSSHVQVACLQAASPGTGSTTGAVRMLTAVKVGSVTLRTH